MHKEDIQKHLDLAAEHSIIIDQRELDEFPGDVRIITIHRGNKVTVEYLTCRSYLEDPMEKGAVFTAYYKNLEELITELEKYLGVQHEKWKICTHENFKPKFLDSPNREEVDKLFYDAVRNKTLNLPSWDCYKPTSMYWRHIVEYGEFRPELEYYQE